MTNNFITKMITDVCAGVGTLILGIVGYYVKKFLAKHADFIKSQEELVQTQIGTEQYNKNKSIAIDLIYGVEQLAKEFDWDKELKHSKATQLISEKTGLSQDEIYNLIKSTVGKINENRKNSIGNVINTTPIKTGGITESEGITQSTSIPSDVNSSEVKPVEHAIVESVVNTPIQENSNIVSQDIINAINELQKLVNK